MPSSDTCTAGDYARHLLETAGFPGTEPADCPAAHPARRWAECGLLRLTGQPDGPGQICPLPLAAQADGVIAALRGLAADAPQIAGAELLGERAKIAGHMRAGAISPGGSCRLLDTLDGAVALNLARDEDWDLLPAWLESEGVIDWDNVAGVVTSHKSQPLVDRGRLMGLPVCDLAPPRSTAVPWFSVAANGSRRAFRPSHRPRVVDLSSLWAGPLCSRLLQGLGAEVIKVESMTRPDGARSGPPDFFERMNAGKQMMALDLRSAPGLAELKRLITGADIVIEASRPRALRQLGINAEALVRKQPGLTWVSITGYGRQAPEADWVAFGDDAGVAAGLSWIMRIATGETMFCGDAIADPLTGMHAALAAWASYLQGGGQLLSLPMRDVVTHCIQYDLPESDDEIADRQRAWSAMVT